MKRRAVAVAVLTLAALTQFPSTAASQARFFFGGGLTTPTGDYSEYAKTGWMAVAGLGWRVPDTRFGVNGSVMYGVNNHEDEGDKTTLYGVFASGRYSLHEPDRPGLFLSGGLGIQVHKYSSEDFPSADESETQFAGHGGLGVDVPLGRSALFGLASYVVGDTSYLRFLLGLSFPLGGN